MSQFWGSHQNGAFLDRYRRLCFLQGRQVKIKLGYGELQRQCLDIDDQGRLLLNTPASVKAVASGEVTKVDLWSYRKKEAILPLFYFSGTSVKKIEKSCEKSFTFWKISGNIINVIGNESLNKKKAHLAELADAQRSGRCSGNRVKVRLL